MTYDLPVPIPQADNPYMPLQMQLAHPNLDPGDFTLVHPLPESPPRQHWLDRWRPRARYHDHWPGVR